MPYLVLTVDPDNDRYTPQPGVPWLARTFGDLRRALRSLRDNGYPASRLPVNWAGDCRVGDYAVLIERIDESDVAECRKKWVNP